MKVKLLAGSVLAAMLGLAPSARTADTTTIAETITNMKGHTVLALAIKESGEAETLKGPGPFTLFAPSDAAFKKFDDQTITKVVADKAKLKQLVRGHVVKGKLTVPDLKGETGKEVKSLGSTSLKVEETKDGLKIGAAKISGDGIACSNGTIYVIDIVLMPP
ncbi:MAG: fasciclin domain-containing protein [Planctomycetia bacterium]|nr:fasciclin domain-containing protein [Planctomycetia bacterium]